MNKENLGNWQKTVDQADFTPLECPIGEGVVGHIEKDGDRIWQRVTIKYGKGQWAYWLDHGTYTVCADLIFNGDAPHFAGYLARPHPGTVESTEWLLVEPKLRPQIQRPSYIENVERREGRYETNDVDRIQKGQKSNPGEVPE